MSSLSTLPIELLECITGVIVPSEQMRLWQCGDRILNMKLKNGGLTSTTLHWSSTPWMPWPHTFFAIFTRLTTVNWTVDTGSSLCPSLDLNLLPQTLHRLQLDCDDVFHHLRQQSSNLNVVFPSLQILKLKGKRLREENLKQLPQHLVELSVSSEDDTTDITVLSSISSAVLFKDLPTTLEHLNLRIEVVDLAEVGNDLPGGLKSLAIWRIEANFDWLLKLPKSLKKLTIESINGHHSNWSLLPTELEELDLAEPISNSTLHSLPKHLKSLICPICPFFSEDDIEHLPKNLTRVDFHLQQEPLTHIGLQRLPNNLRDHTFPVKVTHQDILSIIQPETRRLRLLKEESSLALNLFPLPPKLTSLTIDCVTDDICGLLPPQMTYLKVDGGFITSEGASKLPKSLKYLSIHLGVMDVNETIPHIRCIPHLHLGLSCSAGSSARNATENWLSFLKSPPLASHFHETINNRRQSDSGKILELNDWEPQYLLLGESAFQPLSTLTNLSVLRIRVTPGGAHIPASYIQHVPKSLTDLYFCSLDDFPSVADLATLPKGLRRLELWVPFNVECSWKDQDLKALPPSLQIFDLKCDPFFPTFSRDVTSSLPPHLMEMNVNYGNIFFFTKPLDRLYPL